MGSSGAIQWHTSGIIKAVRRILYFPSESGAVNVCSDIALFLYRVVVQCYQNLKK